MPRTIRNVEEMAKAMYHALGGLGLSLTPQIVFVTDPKSSWFNTNGARRVGSSNVLSRGSVVIRELILVNSARRERDSARDCEAWPCIWFVAWD